MTNSEKYIYINALNKWGFENQVYMLFEEMSELQNAICKYRRSRMEAQSVIEEIADVEIMAEQMSVIFGNDEVEKVRKEKLERLKDRLKDSESQPPTS